MIYRKGAILAIVAGVLALGILVGASSIERVLAAGDAGPNTSCSSSSPCASFSNAGAGPGVASSSKGGSGLTGTTTLIGSGTNNGSGVLGTDASTSGNADSGVKGVSKSGTGIFGSSKSGTGVKGSSTTGSGVVGTSASLAAAIAGTSTSSTGIGVSGVSPMIGVEGTGNIGVFAEESGRGTALQLEAFNAGGDLILAHNDLNTVFSVDEGGNIATSGLIFSGEINSSTIFAFGTSSNPAIDGIGENSSFASVEADSAAPGFLYDGFNQVGSAVYFLDTSGNMTIAGNLFTAGFCNTGCITQKRDAKRVVSYTPHESQPTMEDFGSARLAHGHVHVALGADFANVINRGAGYLVFLTPDGDCNGLFVADKSAQGFDVGELHGGTSDVAFDYRIVAKPYGDHSARLPMVEMNAVKPAAAAPRHRHP